MDEITIKKHSFDMAKNRLKEFSEKTDAELAIDKVQTEGNFLGIGDHRVTGYELNRRLEIIQKHFIDVNTTSNKVIKEFREVYNALDALDKEYITAIVANVEAIKKTSDDVRMQQGTLKQHNEKLSDHQNKLDVHQLEIEKNVANISKIVTTLKVFKEKLEGYKHLTDIDKIWNDCKNIQNEIRVVSENITKFSRKATEDIEKANNKNKALSELINKDMLTLHNEVKSFKEFSSNLSEKIEFTANLLNSQIPVIKEMTSFVEQLKDMSHLEAVDSMWEDINQAKENFVIVENSLQSIEADILHIKKHLEKVDSFVAVVESYNHLKDIDNMWDDIDICKKDIKKINVNIQMQQRDLDNLATTNKNHTDILSRLEQNDSKMSESIISNTNEICFLKNYKNKLSEISHLNDVDGMWNNIEEHTSKLIECDKRNEELIDNIKKNKKEVNDNIEEAVQEVNVAIETLTRKIKYVYWIAGGSVGFAIIELILLLMRVI